MDTIIAPITPLIISSVILVRISGPDSLKALTFIDGCKNIIPKKIYYGNFIDKKVNYTIAYYTIILKLHIRIQVKMY